MFLGVISLFVAKMPSEIKASLANVMKPAMVEFQPVRSLNQVGLIFTVPLNQWLARVSFTPVVFKAAAIQIVRLRSVDIPYLLSLTMAETLPLNQVFSVAFKAVWLTNPNKVSVTQVELSQFPANMVWVYQKSMKV